MRLLALCGFASCAAIALLLGGCSDDDDGDSSASSVDAAPPPFQIVAANGAPLSVFAGDAVQLRVIATTADGGTSELPDGAVVTWTEPFVATAMASETDAAADPFPLAGSNPTAAWIDNPGRPDVDSANVLYVLDPGTAQNGTLTVTASVSGAANGAKGTATGTIAVAPAPAGDWTRGGTTYAENCATCHGATGHGTAVNADGTYTMKSQSYAYPAPGLNAEPGNVASDPAWNVALLAVAARSDVDNGGMTLRTPMPNWGAVANAATGVLLTAQDFADIYAYLKTQAQ